MPGVIMVQRNKKKDDWMPGSGKSLKNSGVKLMD